MFANQPVKPKNPDGILRIISVGRLSQAKDTEAATLQSLEAIRKENERLLAGIYSGPTHIRYLAEQISGMVAERSTMGELWELASTGEWDLIIAEDLSRVFRNPAFQLSFLQQCCDVGIRAICFADNIDTADETWEAAALIAAVRHGLPIPDTRRRIKRTATNTFKNGGMVLRVKAFYSKVSREDAATGKYGPKGLRIRRQQEYQWAVDEIRSRLHSGESPRYIVAWLKAEKIPCGTYVKSGEWTQRVFRDLLQDPILHGTRSFRDVVYKQTFRTGKYKRTKNEAPDLEFIEELAFMTRDEQEAMLATVGWQIDWGGVRPAKRPSHRKGISRYESTWPGQSTECSPCGAIMFAMGAYLRCSKSFPHLDGKCWNHVQVPIGPLREAIVKILMAQCEASEEARDLIVSTATRHLQQQQGRNAAECDALNAKVKNLETQERNLRRSISISEAVAEEELTALVHDLAAVTKELKSIRANLASAHSARDPVEQLAADEIAKRLDDVLPYLLRTSFEMAEWMRQFVPRCVIVPVQAHIGGQVYARAKLSVRLNLQNYDDLTDVVVDLFEPPLHIRILQEAVKIRSQTPQPTLKEIGAQLDVSYMSVKRALGYAKIMQEAGATEVFRELIEKPENAARWREAS